jgi:hypothetical protein
MKNITTSVSKDRVLTITIDLKKELGPSKSGKTVLIATTEGNKAVANEDGKQIILGLNLYRYADER